MIALAKKAAAGIACLSLTGCCACDGSCGFTPNGPQYRVQLRHMRAICRDRGGVRQFHETVYNGGATALVGGIDFTCNDGYADTLEWDDQGPDHLPRVSASAPTRRDAGRGDA